MRFLALVLSLVLSPGISAQIFGTGTNTLFTSSCGTPMAELPMYVWSQSPYTQGGIDVVTSSYKGTLKCVDLKLAVLMMGDPFTFVLPAAFTNTVDSPIHVLVTRWFWPVLEDWQYRYHIPHSVVISPALKGHNFYFQWMLLWKYGGKRHLITSPGYKIRL